MTDDDDWYSIDPKVWIDYEDAFGTFKEALERLPQGYFFFRKPEPLFPLYCHQEKAKH